MKSKTKSHEKKIWVEIEVNKYTDGITVFRGQMLKTDLDAWLGGELSDSSIKLEKAYWFLEDNICVLGKGDDHTRQYTGEIFIRADTIMLIFILKDDSFPTRVVPDSDNIFPFPGRSKQ
jgi:hypothetical protein